MYQLMLNHIKEMCTELFLSQVITTPTHKDGNILDLVIVNNRAMVHDTTVIPVLRSTSHHNIIQISTIYKAFPPPSHNSRPKPSMFNTGRS